MLLTEKYRPASLSDVQGQPGAISWLKEFVCQPYPCALLFHGSTGTGKTSAALEAVLTPPKPITRPQASESAPVVRSAVQSKGFAYVAVPSRPWVWCAICLAVGILIGASLDFHASHGVVFLVGYLFRSWLSPNRTLLRRLFR